MDIAHNKAVVAQFDQLGNSGGAIRDDLAMLRQLGALDRRR